MVALIANKIARFAGCGFTSSNHEIGLIQAYANIHAHIKGACDVICRYFDLFLEHIDSNAETGTTAAHAQKLDSDELQTVNDVIVTLADVHLRQGHKQRADIYAWFYHYLCNVTYLQDSLTLCVQNEINDDGWRNLDVEQMKASTEQRLVESQEMFIRHLRRHLVNEKDSALNEQWLESFVQYINEAFKTKKADIPEIHIEEAAAASTEQSSPQKPADSNNKEKKMEFTKIQKAISKLVHNITQDVRRRYHRKKLSEETLRSSVSCEILAMMSPITDDSELEALFERMIADDEEMMTSSSADASAATGVAAEGGRKSLTSSRRGSLSRLSSRRCSTSEVLEGER